MKRSAGLTPLLCVASLAGQVPTWEDLESRGARIARVEILVQDVFDLEDPGENTWIGRVANALHPTTRDAVVRRALTFAVGGAVEARRIHEAERELRSYRFIKDARIDPVYDADGSLVARVVVRDAWTLKASVGFSQVGGQRLWGLGLRDQNLAGFGKDLVFSYASDADRTTQAFQYGDRQFLGSRWTLRASYQFLSDGRSRSLELVRPFKTLEAPWSAELGHSSQSSTLIVRDRLIQVYAASSKLVTATVGGSRLVSLEADRALRLGLLVELQEARYGPLLISGDPALLPPPDLSPRRMQGPALSFEWLQDRFQGYRNLVGMDFVEDQNLGWSGRVILGHYGRNWGSLQPGPFARGSLAKGWAPDPQSLVLLRATASGRELSGTVQDARGSLSLVAYNWSLPSQVWGARLGLDAASRPAPEHQIHLGGEDGLRGYPNFMHLGDRRWVVSIEDRILTQQRWLGILRLGFVVYADVGAIHRRDGGGWSRTYANLGGGFRFGDLKSSLGKVVLVTVAFPLVREPGQDRYQIVVGNVVQF
ncbi:MAG: hypothetical protein Q8K67_09150 [Geothrix sp.]|nr:hypothetical protein [Geothrix sp.]